MGSDSLQAAKAKLRQTQRATRAARSAGEQNRASEAVVRHLVAHLQGQNHLKVAAFMAIRGEIDLAALRGALPELAWYIPKVVERDGPLLFGRWDPASLATGTFGILEPSGALVSVDALDVVLAPGLAFTREGDRLGMGGGFYDRTLNGYGGRVIGVAYEEEVLETIPSGAHDRRVDSLASPSGWQDCHPTI
ncbi:MAG: 5-formyltetrahydrofolate cyclo-ligase [Myxococcota bacterium]|nr:5-formyltetrahydrofolate cyclo-ligase [Myxococcota bacterium]